jgi:type IV secretory pathway protease TraF
VYVNDVFYPQSKPLAQDREGRFMPQLTLDHYELKENEILLMSDSADDPFDGRYFGLIEVDQVDSVISPILQ